MKTSRWKRFKRMKILTMEDVKKVDPKMQDLEKVDPEDEDLLNLNFRHTRKW